MLQITIINFKIHWNLPGLKEYDCDQSFATNALKHLMDQLEARILQTDQLKNVPKRL